MNEEARPEKWLTIDQALEQLFPYVGRTKLGPSAENPDRTVVVVTMPSEWEWYEQLSEFRYKMIIGEWEAEGRIHDISSPLEPIEVDQWEKLREIEVHESAVGERYNERPRRRDGVWFVSVRVRRATRAASNDRPTPEVPSALRPIALATLDDFLSRRVADLPPGDPGLTEHALLEAVRREFEDNKVSRQQVRDWIRKDMPPSKRFDRGDKPNQQSA